MMRIRTVLSFGMGAAVGAGVTWLKDPDHGRERRAEARRWAMAQGRRQAAAGAKRTLQAARQYGEAALEGFREGAQQDEPVAR